MFYLFRLGRARLRQTRATPQPDWYQSVCLLRKNVKILMILNMCLKNDDDYVFLRVDK